MTEQFRNSKCLARAFALALVMSALPAGPAFAQGDPAGPLILGQPMIDAADSGSSEPDSESPDREPPDGYPVGPVSEGDQGLPFSRDPSLDSLLAPSFVRIEQDAADLMFSGTWTDHSLSQASGGSYRRNATAGSTAELTFDGTWVSLGLIADRSGGEAELFIDGITQGVIDLYRNGSSAEAMPVSISFDGLAPGLHSLTIQVLGTANPSSSSTRVQLDYVDYGDGSLLPDGNFEQDNGRVLVSSGWSTVAYAGAGGGNYIRGTAATAWFPFAGDSFSLHTLASFNGGKARLYVDGLYLDTIDMFELVSDSAAIPRVFSYEGFGPGPHVLQISTYEDFTTIDRLATPGSGPFIDPNPPVTGIARFEADHPSIRYNGLPFFQSATSWVRVANIFSNRASEGEFVYSETAGDVIEFDFDGEWLGIGFATDRAGGQAEIAIDGDLVETIDLYTRFEDTASRYFRDLGPGPHTVSITVLGSASSSAVGARAYLDFFDVWGGQTMADGTFEEDSERLYFSDGWGRIGNVTASGGAYGLSSVNFDATVWFPFTGDSVTWQGFARFNHSDVDVRLNGVSLGFFDLYGYDELPRAFSLNGLGPGPHVLEVRGYRSDPVTIDAFITPAIGPDPEPPAPAAFSRLEENHPAMRYNGEAFRTMPQSWSLQEGLPGSAAYNLSSSTPGHVWSLEFEGDWINLGFRSSASSGTAEVIIDGLSRGPIDTANGINDVKNFVFGDLGAGPHTLEVIVVSGAVMPDYVDVWSGQPTEAGWYEPALEGSQGGLSNFSNRRWWLIGSDPYARSEDFLTPFTSANTNLWFTFTGKDLSLLAYERNNTRLQVLIDGVDYGIFDLSTTPPFRDQPTALHFPGLGEGPHIVQVALFSVGGSLPRIDAFEVNPDGFFSYTPEVEWFDTTATEVLPDATGVGFASTIAIGDVDGNGLVELVAPGVNGRLYVYRGDGQDAGNGTPILWSSDAVGPAAEPALADLDGDGDAEIILSGKNGTFAFHHDGQIAWSNPDVVSYFAAEEFGWGGPSIGNLDLDPEPEIVIASREDALYVLDHLGNVLYSDSLPGRFSTVPVLADITGDGVLDIVVAEDWTLKVIDYFNGGVLAWSRDLPDPITILGGAGVFGAPAIADLDGDGRPEIIINWGHVIEALQDDGSLLWRYETGATDLFRPSAVTVADVTGDGQVNLITASARSSGFIIFNHQLMVLDAAGGLVWQQDVADNTASASGVAAQDLTGNGVWEILWNGNVDGLLVLNGPDGKRLYNEPFTRSGTVVDYPTLGDVDGDGEAEVVVSGANGLFVFGHTGRWVDSRPVWNQHNYHINNIGNDWSIPFTEDNSWEVHNTYRTQTPDRDPACVIDNGEFVAPAIVELSPQSGDVLPAGVQLVIGGRALQVGLQQPILEVQINGVPVDVLDPSGSFFAIVELEPGPNPIELRAADRCAATVLSIELNGGGDDDDPWADLADASVLFEARFSDTTHDPSSERLLTRVQAFNAGPSVPGPVLMTVGGDADPSIGLLNADGFTPQGEPYVIVVPAGGVLAAGGLSDVRDLALANPRRAPIDFTPRWIAPVNQPPYFSSIPDVRAVTGQLWRYPIAVGDSNGDAVTLSLPTSPTGMSVVDGELVWTPTAIGSFDVVVEADDGRGGSARQGFTLQVDDGSFNRPPLFITTPPAQIPTGGEYVYAAAASDLDGDPLTYSLLASPAGVTVDSGSGEVRWPKAGPGQHSLVLQADDGRGGQAAQSWTLYVGEPAATPPGPAFASIPVGFAAVGVQYRYVFRVNSFGTDAPVVSLAQGPAAMQLDPVGKTLTWVPSGADLGAQTIELRAVDSSGLEAIQRFDLQVLPELPNQPPYFVSAPSLNARTGSAYSYLAVAIDPEFESLSWSLASAPAGMTVDSNSGQIEWTPATASPAEVPVVLQAADPQGAVASQSFTIRLRDANVAPVITTSPPMSIVVGEFYSVRMLATDADGDPVTWRLLEGPSGMTLHPRIGWLHWTTTGAAPGTYPVTVEVEDDWGGQDLRSFVIELLADSEVPEVALTIGRIPACRGETVNVCVEASDNVGLSQVTLDIDGQPRALDSSRCYRWTPPEAGLIPAVAQATDPSGQSGQAAETLQVADCNDEEAPVVTLIAPLSGVAFDRPEPIVVTIEDNTPDILTWEVRLRLPGTEQVQVLASGTGPVSAAEVAVFDPTGLQSGDYEIEVLASDGVQTGGIKFVMAAGIGNKPGRVAFTTADLTWQLGALPLTIGRSYDSLDAGPLGRNTGDFSPGWRLALSANVQDSVPDIPPELDLLGGLNGQPFTTQTRVTVVKPNGERVGFRFDPQPKSFPAAAQYKVNFEPDSGVTDTLRAVGWPDTVFNFGAGFANYIIPYNPTIYELETQEGVIYVIDEFDGLLEVRDVLGGVLSVTDDGIESSWGVSVDYVRDTEGRIIEILLPKDQSGEPAGRLRYGYDETGNLVSVTDLAGNVSTFVYGDPNHPHHITAMFDALGNPIARHVFDVDGRLIAHCTPDGDVATLAGCSQFTFDVAGGVQSIFDARGFRSDLFFDDQGLLSARRDWYDSMNFVEEQWVYDEAGRVLEYHDRDDGLTLREYDDVGNEIRLILPDGATWTREYGSCRNEWIRACDPLGNCMSQTFNDQCQPTSLIDALGSSTYYEYDQRGLLVRVVDEVNQEREFTYNERGQVIQSTHSDGQTTTMNYNTLGQITEIVNRDGRVRQFIYDDGGRLVEENWPSEDFMVQYEYGATGLPTRFVSPESLLSIEYWPTGKPRRIEHSAPGAPSWWMEYDYDGNGNVTEVRDSVGGVTSYIHDGINRLISIRQSGAGVIPKRVDIDSSGGGIPFLVRRYGDLAATLPGPVTEYSFACASCPGLLTAIEHRMPDGTLIDRLDYSRNSARQIVAIEDGDGLHEFVIDGRGWLVDASHPPTTGIPSGSFTWDPAGNWLSRPGQPGPVMLSYAQGDGGHRMMSDGVHEYSYTEQGELLLRQRISDGEKLELTHSPISRLEAAELRNASDQIVSSASYVHSANGWRVAAEVDGQVRYFLHDFDNAAVAVDAAGQQVWRRLLMQKIDRPLAIERDGQLRWLLTDHIGSVRKEVDNAGLLLASYRYDSFGRQISGTQPTLDDALRFTSREFDVPGGLAYYRARVYDASAARFVAEDPLPPWHYRYVDNNPLMFVDPSGELSALQYALIVCELVAAVSNAYYIAVPIKQNFDNINNAIRGYAYSNSVSVPTPNPYDFVSCGLATPAGVNL